MSSSPNIYPWLSSSITLAVASLLFLSSLSIDCGGLHCRQASWKRCHHLHGGVFLEEEVEGVGGKTNRGESR